MKQQKKFTIRINEDIYEAAKEKCENQLGISLSNLTKIFLRSFISQRGVGFYIGDDDLCGLFTKWLTKKQLIKSRGVTHYYAGPYLKDLFKLDDK